MAYCPRITHRREITPPAPHSPRIFFHSLGRKVLNMTNVKEEAEKGEKLALLIAIRGKLAESLDRTESGRDIAALSKRLIQVALRTAAECSGKAVSMSEPISAVTRP